MVAALASYLDARACGGRWLVRIENIDPPREVSGATDSILATLERWQLHWDDAVLFQSTRLPVYRETAERLLEAGLAFRCRCTRRTLQAERSRVYPGHCRTAAVSERSPHAIRVAVGDGTVACDDLLQGPLQWHLATDVGDFVIWRRDDLCAYQLAVTLDDDYQGVTHVVRGTDLIDSTPRQLHLRRLLGLPAPRFAHFPIAVDGDGAKLSKQTGARPIDAVDPRQGLHAALCFLRQAPPPGLARAPLTEQLEWAVSNWRRAPLEQLHSLEIDAEHRLMSMDNNDAAPQQP